MFDNLTIGMIVQVIEGFVRDFGVLEYYNTEFVNVIGDPGILKQVLRVCMHYYEYIILDIICTHTYAHLVHTTHVDGCCGWILKLGVAK